MCIIFPVYRSMISHWVRAQKHSKHDQAVGWQHNATIPQLAKWAKQQQINVEYINTILKLNYYRIKIILNELFNLLDIMLIDYFAELFCFWSEFATLSSMTMLCMLFLTSRVRFCNVHVLCQRDKILTMNLTNIFLAIDLGWLRLDLEFWPLRTIILPGVYECERSKVSPYKSYLGVSVIHEWLQYTAPNPSPPPLPHTPTPPNTPTPLLTTLTPPLSLQYTPPPHRASMFFHVLSM